MFYESEEFRFEIEDSEVPWVKIFTKNEYKELSELPIMLRAELFESAMIVEKEMLEFYKPTKINIASFGNYLPKVHLHIMARFSDDSFFPEPIWGSKQRDGFKRELRLDEFTKRAVIKLDEFFTVSG
ncbi:MAG: HIT family protein [Campylobacterales bacterium]